MESTNHIENGLNNIFRIIEDDTSNIEMEEQIDKDSMDETIILESFHNGDSLSEVARVPEVVTISRSGKKISDNHKNGALNEEKNLTNIDEDPEASKPFNIIANW